MSPHIEIPPAEQVDIDSLRVDLDNPNRMSDAALQSLKESITRWGFIVPIITNRDLLIADGEQRLTAAQELGMRQVSVVRLPVDDVDRRLIRQVMNKLKGEHIYDLDALEFQRIAEAGREDDLKRLINLSEEDMKSYLSTIQGEEVVSQELDVEEEEREKNAQCPRCGYEFNPDNFLVDAVTLEPEEEQLEGAIKAGQDRGLGKQNTVVLDLSFQTTPPEITERSIAVAEAFGVGVDETVRFDVFHRLELSYDDTDLIYVTGDSGSGKTTLLRLLGEYEEKRGRKVVNFGDVQPDADEVVIDGLGEDATEAMRLLSAAGLSEAFLMLRRYRELSDGQRYRYRLAKMLTGYADVYIIDELGATLDRVMARVLAYSLQKWARRMSRMVVAASTHHDLIEDFNPDILIFKGFGEETQIRYRDAKTSNFSLVGEMEVEEASQEDYGRLERFHYLAGDPRWVKARFKLTYRGRTVGVVVYTAPFLQVKLRNRVLPRYRGGGAKTAELVNREVVRLSRIVIHPKFRGVGLAVRLVRETMPLTGFRVVETIAAMARYNPFFEKAGMTRVGVMGLTEEQKNVKATIRRLGGDPAMMHSPMECRRFLEGLNKKQTEALVRALMKGVESFRGQGERGKKETDRMMRELALGGLEPLLGNLVPTERVYLYWENPESNGSAPQIGVGEAGAASVSGVLG